MRLIRCGVTPIQILIFIQDVWCWCPASNPIPIKSWGFYSPGCNFPWLLSVPLGSVLIFSCFYPMGASLSSYVCACMCWESEQHLQHWLHPNECLVFQPTPVGSVHVDSGTSAVTRDSHVHRDRPSQQALRNQVRCSQLLQQCHIVWHLSEFLLDQRSRSCTPLEVAGADSCLGHGKHNSCWI